MRTIFTIGYEGSGIDNFLFTLGAAGVERVVDVRDVPLSRKKGFSKSALAVNLGTAGIEYSHLKPLGDPKEGRIAMRRGDRDTFLRIYEMQLRTREATEALEQAMAFARKETIALLCYERSPQDCHRSIVAREMSANEEFKIFHLGIRAPQTMPSHRICSQATANCQNQ